MRDKLLSIIGAAILAAVAFVGGSQLAWTQAISVPQVPNLNTNDLIQVVPKGVPQAESFYGTPAQVTHQPGYVFAGTITTDPAYTFVNGQTNYFAHAAGTITTVTLTTEPNPGDGARECWWLDQTTTTLTWTANTGQTIGSNVLTAGVAKNPQCITYQASSATWFSSM
jgi:hypothetical protein